MNQKRHIWIAIPLSIVVLIGLFLQRPSTTVFAGFTPTATNTPAPTNTPVPTNTPLPTNTTVPTNTAVPPVVGTPDSASSPTPSGSADPVSTPSRIPDLGNGPRANDLLTMGIGLLLAVTLLAFGWWKVWQTYNQKSS